MSVVIVNMPTGKEYFDQMGNAIKSKARIKKLLEKPVTPEQRAEAIRVVEKFKLIRKQYERKSNRS